jgi:hypothetical protein
VLAKHGRPTKGDDVTFTEERGNSAAYLASRLKRDAGRKGGTGRDRQVCRSQCSESANLPEANKPAAAHQTDAAERGQTGPVFPAHLVSVPIRGGVSHFRC